ncbi:rod shape-determining protein MreD [Flavobacterium salilacus subsp. salilacus]|uniref:rod shape-determining protein MreD n=1 Tax=Flavobacterium TaxID=237 RepID=UPI001075064E|nr:MULTISPECIES: rod shape-determining protein MreD [Flavobacterium]KAF2519957.1 rod shape-determining protein MreD [Flavobacterium salilacus subsp. salilacus]MBE1614132.1 rod shape-determining protein MreD [Flavobacterium sp. SaA2.13]NDI97780.1 rod shape-determining protein MreD [Flavobacterium salilacus subsp. altitudinum]
MNNSVITNSARFIILLLAQVVVFNRIELFGFINAFPYILFILLYPVDGNRALLLILSFLLGISVDAFLNSGGAHATACLVLAYMRPSIFKFSFGLSYEYQTVKINDRLSPERFSFILISVVIHHIILYLLEVFRFSLILDILLQSLFSTIFTLILCIIIIYLIKPGKQ